MPPARDPGAILQTHHPLASLGLRGMEFAGNLRLNVRLGSFRDRAPSLTDHLNLVWEICQDFTKQEIPAIDLCDLGDGDCSSILGYNVMVLAGLSTIYERWQ